MKRKLKDETKPTFFSMELSNEDGACTNFVCLYLCFFAASDCYVIGLVHALLLRRHITVRICDIFSSNNILVVIFFSLLFFRFPRRSWSVMSYVECSPKGYGYKGPKFCRGIEAYPTIKDKTGRIINVSGERSLEFLAKQVRFSDFDASLEKELPAIGTTCKLR